MTERAARSSVSWIIKARVGVVRSCWVRSDNVYVVGLRLYVVRIDFPQNLFDVVTKSIRLFAKMLEFLRKM